MTAIDSHMHLNFNGLSLRRIINYLDREKIDICWLLSWEEIHPGPWHYQHLAVEDIHQAFLKYPQRIIPFYAPDPHRPDASSTMESWHQRGIRGCGELKATLNWNSELVRSVLKTARKLKMPVVFHMEENTREIPCSNAFFDKVMFSCVRGQRAIYRIPKPIITLLADHYAPLRKKVDSSHVFPGYMLDFASLETTLKDFHDVKFVAHGMMFWKYYSSDATGDGEWLPIGPVKGEGIIWRLLRDYPNLYADFSSGSGINALKRDRQSARSFLSQFEDKILYGTDNLFTGQKQYIDSLGLDKATLNKIYGENARKVLS